MKMTAMLSIFVLIVQLAFAFTGSFGGSRTEELSSVIGGSDGILAVGFSEYYDEPFIQTLVIEADSDGNLSWTKEYGTPGDDIGRCIVLTDEGMALLVSRVEITGSAKLMATLIDGNGSQVWQNFYGKYRDYSPWSVAVTYDGFVIAGQCMTDKNYLQGSLIKVDLSGRTVWEREFGKDGIDGAQAVTNLEDGNILATGYSWIEERQYLWLALLDSYGKSRWQKLIGNSEGPFLEGRTAIEAENGFLVGGISSNFSGKAYLAKVDTFGEIVEETLLDDKYPALLSILEDNENYVGLVSFVTVEEEGFGLIKITKEGEVVTHKAFNVNSFEPHAFT
ncbi:MAG: hypothetical protein JW697_05650 [Kosmotogaceae bacterium]|nr:hypothetical protein [Kosmotogaceae bacterium]